jgi:hypothetical protein
MKLDNFKLNPNIENIDGKWNIYKLELPAELVERSTGAAIHAKAHATIYQLGSSDIYTLLTSGGHKSSNRWHRDITLEEAKARATSWAARRYKEGK